MTPEEPNQRDWRPVVTLDRRAFVAILVGVCILSSAVGAAFGLIAETGPSGVPGKRGPVGPEGPEGPAGSSNQGEIEELEAAVEELREEAADRSELESRVEDLESALEGIGSVSPDDLCEEFGILC